MGSNENRKIALIATLDTKGEELQFVKDVIDSYGVMTLTIDTGTMGTPAFQPDYSRDVVAREGGMGLSHALGLLPKGELIGNMARGAASIVRKLHDKGNLAGVLALGGGQGTFIGTTAMKALPLGVPKVMVSTLGAGNLRGFVGTKDIAVFNSVTDILGLNAISKQVLINAATAIVGMSKRGKAVCKGPKFTIGATMLGTTTVGMMYAKSLLETKGYEVVTFHANGAGGSAMEELTSQGFFNAVLDYSTHEVLAHLCNGIFSSGPHRMESAGRQGIPQVVVPGGVDYLIMGPVDTLNEDLKSRPLIVHNDQITLVRSSSKEMALVGSDFARKLNTAKGPVAVVVPLGGFSEPDSVGGLFYNPDADMAFVEALRAQASPNVQVHLVDAHVNDSEFVEKVIAVFEETTEL